MKKIVSNILIVSMQLLVGGLFLVMLFSEKADNNNNVVVVRNNNLNKMADSVSVLFVKDSKKIKEQEANENKVEELNSAEESKQKEEVVEEPKKEATEKKEDPQPEVQDAAKEEENRQPLVVVDPSKYISKPEMGFNVTTGNKTYNLSDNDFNIVAGVVACEAGSDKDDALAVMSVILNRADICYGGNCDPLKVVAQGNGSQFTCYLHQGNPARVADVVKDALNGVRNNAYRSFNGWGSGVSNNYIVDHGNRYY